MSPTPTSFDKAGLDKAGRILIDGSEDFDAWFKAVQMVNEWRTLHRVPLQTFRTNLRKRVGKKGIVAQRLKRLTSIMSKLERLDWLSLSQMQDIGGCRAVVGSADAAYEVASDLASSRIRHELVRSKDYVISPRSTGYRGIHLVYSYRTDRASRKPWEGLNVELQIRSERQHQWATAVETVGAFIGDDLKSGFGDQLWLRFFALMSTVIANQEDKPIVPDTPDSRDGLVREIMECDRGLGGIEARLGAFRAIARQLPAVQQVRRVKDPWVVLRLDLEAKRFGVRTFRREQWDSAAKFYMDEEVKHRDNRRMETVMVSVAEVRELKRAFPNYYADLNQFRRLLRETLG